MATFGDIIRFVVSADGQPFRDDVKKDELAFDELIASLRDKDLSIDVNIVEAENNLDRFKARLLEIQDASTHIKVDDKDAQGEVDKLNAKLNDIVYRALKITADDKDAVTKIEDLQIKIDKLNEKYKRIPIGVEDGSAKEKIDAIRMDLDTLHGKTIPVNVDTNQAQQGMGLLGASIMGLLPLLSPLTAATAGALIGLSGMATAAGAGFVGFGVVAKSTLSDVFQASKTLTKQQQAYNNAVNDKQRLAAMQKAKQAWDSLDQSQQDALTQMKSFSSFWQNFTKQFEAPVLNVFINGMKMLQTILPHFSTSISQTGEAITKLERDATKAANSPFWKTFFSWIGASTFQSITSIGEAIGNIMKGLAGMFMAFTPGQQSMEKGLVNLTARFAQWGATLDSNTGFQKFVQYFLTQGPKVMQLLGSLSQLIINLLAGMAPVGNVMMQIITSLATWINKLMTINPLIGELIASIVPAIGIFKLGSAAVVGINSVFGAIPATIAKVVGIFGILQRTFVVLQFALISGIRLIGATFMANPIGFVISLIVAAIMVAVVLIEKHWTTIRTFLESTWKSISQTADTVWNAIVGFFKKYGLDILGAVTGPIGQMVIFLAKHWSQIIADVKKLGSDIGNFFANLGQDALNWGKNLIHMFAQGIQNDISTVENAVSGVANTLKHWLGFHSPSAGLPDSGQWAPNFMKMFSQGINDGIPDLNTTLGNVANALQTAQNKRLAAQQRANQKRLAAQQKAAQKRLAAQQKAAQQAQQQTQTDNLRLQNIYQAYSQTMLNLRNNYAKQAAAIEDSLVKAEDAAMQKYTQAVDSRAQQLQQSMGLFSSVTHKQVSAQTLLGNIQDQVSTFEGWTNNLAALTKRGVDQGFLAELQKAGPQAADEVKALASMTDRQLQNYVNLWQQQSKDAHDEAVNELAPMKADTEAQIEALKKAADQKLQELTKTFDTNMANAKQKSLDQIKMLEQTAPPAIKTAVQKMGNAMTAQLGVMLSQAQSYVAQINAVLSSVGGGLAPNTASMVQNGSRSTSSVANQTVTINHTTQINGAVYGVNDLQAAIKQGVQQHVVPALQAALGQPARAITGVR